MFLIETNLKQNALQNVIERMRAAAANMIITVRSWSKLFAVKKFCQKMDKHDDKRTCIYSAGYWFQNI